MHGSVRNPEDSSTMTRIFYHGTDGKVYGPVTELNVQGWYASGYFSSDIQFQITSSDRVEPTGRFYSLGELIERNGRALPFFCSEGKSQEDKKQEETLAQLMKEISSLRTNCAEHNEKFVEKQEVVYLQKQVASLTEEQVSLLRQLKELSKQKETPPVLPHLEKKINDQKKRVDDHDKNFASIKKACFSSVPTEISAVNSKCDRNDTKLNKFVEKQNEMEVAVNGTDKLINEFESFEKSCITIQNAIKEMRETEGAMKKEIESITETIAKVAAQVKLLEEGVAVKSENKSPWDESEAKIDDQEPWNQANERAAIESAEEEKTSSESAPAREESMTTQKQINEKLTTESKPVSRVKDWAAICRDISDDEEEDEEQKKNEDIEEARLTADLTADLLDLLEVYCAALDSSNLTNPKGVRTTGYDFRQMKKFMSTCYFGSVPYLYVREALKKELRRLAHETVHCGACNFTMTTPRHILYHLRDERHVKRRPAEKIVSDSQFSEICEIIDDACSIFLDSSSELAKIEKERNLNARGKILLGKHKIVKQHRPTEEFMNVVTDLALYDGLALPATISNCEEQRGQQKVEITKSIRAWFAVEKNRQGMEEKFKKHFAKWIATCDRCQMAFACTSEYFAHMTTYAHAVQDRSRFAFMLQLWKGQEYWEDVVKLKE